ncbi:hypothetical protein SKAU_G00385730 [Synaphobranchus kaupii]|uniref:Uncharacterized protein n=1 Tax=Synaphobranchus kaupii TaxID=118154 RepID=A0A9Q1EEK1_SYNKA|nr:hypothetical protein SKAU_G00385730 [Synaphobranchus kaupii]
MFLYIRAESFHCRPKSLTLTETLEKKALPFPGSRRSALRRGTPLRLPAGPPEVRSGGGAGRLRRHARASHANKRPHSPLNASTDIGSGAERHGLGAD